MRSLAVCLLLLCLAAMAEGSQPYGIKLNPSGVSLVYPVVDRAGWLITQPTPGRVYQYPDPTRVTHWGDEYYAQDWARGCGQTYGLRLYAGISGKVVFAGWRGAWGNTVVVYDPETRFALKYSHLSEILAKAGEYALAGKTLVGRVGNTGNIQASACTSNPGAHLHLVLFKNVSDPSARPISTAYVSSGSGPTSYAAPFGYAASAALAKSSSDPTVYVLANGTKTGVTAGSFESHGWNFDKYQSVFNSLKGRIFSDSALSGYPKEGHLWPMRDGSTAKSSYSATVYLFEDGRKRALTSGVFSCRALRFGEVANISLGDISGYLPVGDRVAYGCSDIVRQSLRDMAAFAASRFSGSRPDWAGYGFDPDWDWNWELRWMAFTLSSGARLVLYYASATEDPSYRYICYWDPSTNSWRDWQRVQ